MLAWTNGTLASFFADPANVPELETFGPKMGRIEQDSQGPGRDLFKENADELNDNANRMVISFFDVGYGFWKQ